MKKKKRFGVLWAKHEKKCAWCGKVYECCRVDKQTCSAACRQVKSRYRRAAANVTNIDGLPSPCPPHNAGD